MCRLRGARRNATLLGLVAVVVAACGGEDDAAQVFTPARPGVLTVATALPAPGMWTTADGAATADPDVLGGGFEWGIASAMADRFDLQLEVVVVPFDRIVAGDLAGADLSLAQITITGERDEVLDFSVPYATTDAGVVGRFGEEVEDLKTARERTWGVVGGTTDEDVVRDQIDPDTDPTPYPDETAAVAAVATGEVDLALMDLVTALVLASERTDVSVVAQIVTDEEIGAALPAGAGDEPNGRVVDAALRALEADGTVDGLADEWLRPALGQDPDDIPVIRVR